MYGIVITEKGLELDAKLRAGETLKLTRAMVGDGVVPEDVNPRQLTDLISPFAKATSTEPSAVGASTTLVVEYRTDMNGGLAQDRYINEYGIFAEDPDVGEILYFYCNLGDFREPVRAYRENEPVITRRYPVSITVSDGVDVALGYLPSVFPTEAEVRAIVDTHNRNRDAHPDLRTELSTTMEAAKKELDSKVAQAAKPHYITFEPEDWEENELRIGQERHGIEPVSTSCVSHIRQRIGRNVRDLTEGDVETVGDAIIDIMEAALEANKTAPDTYPTGIDGHVQLTWEQVQYFLLEDVLTSDEEAKRQAEALGFHWQERDTLGVPETTTLDEMLTAAYMPAMGSPDTNFRALCTLKVLQGLRLRIVGSGYGYTAINGQGYAAKYDLDGVMRKTWNTLDCDAAWNLSARELVVTGPEPFAGDILVLA